METICFVNIYDHLKKDEFTLPLGLVSLNEILLKKGIPSSIIDFQYLYQKDRFSYNETMSGYIQNMADYILEIKPDIISFYTMCSNLHIVIRVARIISEANSHIKVGLGGPQATLTSKSILKTYEFIDFIGIGEGESTIENIYYFLSNSTTSSDKIIGLVYRDGEKIIAGDMPPMIKNLDVLPILEYTGFDLTKIDTLSLDVGRGCPFACTFCSTQKFWNREYRLKSPRRLVDEIGYYRTKFGIRNFSMQHDMFTADKKRIIEFCRLLSANYSDVKWTCSSRIDVIDYEIVKEMLAAGLSAVFIGIETGSKRMQAIVNKGLDLNDTFKKIVEFSKLGLKMELSFMYGFPNETVTDLEKTLQYIYAIARAIPGISGKIQMHKLSFFAGTDITENNMAMLTYDEKQNYSISYSNERFWNSQELPKEIYPHFYTTKSIIREKYSDIDRFLVIVFLRTLRSFSATYTYLIKIKKLKITDLYIKYVNYSKTNTYFDKTRFFNTVKEEKCCVIREVGGFFNEELFDDICNRIASLELEIALFQYDGYEKEKAIYSEVDYFEAKLGNINYSNVAIFLDRIDGPKISLNQVNIDDVLRDFFEIYSGVCEIDKKYYAIGKLDNYMYSLEKETYEMLHMLCSKRKESFKLFKRYPEKIKYVIKTIGFAKKSDSMTFRKPNKLSEYPFLVSLQITSKCNLKCLHCYNKSGEKCADIQSIKVYEIIDWMKKRKIYFLLLTGGEALLYPEIFEIIKYASKAGIIVELNSNGKLLDKKTIMKLANVGVKCVNISLDGGRDTHNFIRGDSKSFEDAINAIELLKKAKIEVEIKYTCNSRNFAELDEVNAISQRYNIHLNIMRYHKIGRGENNGLMPLQRKQLEYLFELSKQYKNIRLDSCYLDEEKKSNCKDNHNSVMTIRANGDVIICPFIMDNDLTLGNIYEQDIEMINKKRMAHPFVNMNRESFEEPCKNCRDFKMCYGGCRIETEEYRTSKLLKDTQCPYYV